MSQNRYYSSTAARTTLTASITNSDATIPLAAGTGFPSSYPFTLIIDPDLSTEEIVSVTGAPTSLSYPVQRGQDGSTAYSHAAGAVVCHGASARDFDEPQAHIAATAAHGATGAVVGTTNSQTLTNKTLTTPTIASFTNATHDHSNNAGGALLPTAAPTSSAVGDGSVTGSATTYSRTDHKHAREAFAIAGSSAVGDSASAGSAATVAHSDHVHGREAFGSVTAQTTFGASSANGSASTVAHSDHTHGTPTYYPASADTNSVATSETTSSTSYTDLATSGPSRTITTGTLALVIVSGLLSNSGSNDTRMDFAVSGATTRAATDTSALRWFGTTTDRRSVATLVTLTAGSNTFTAKYKVSAGTGTFANRDIIVIPLAA